MTVARLCLGCASCSYDEGTIWQTEYSGGHENSFFSCKEGHWSQEMGWVVGNVLSQLEEHLLLASTCPDWNPR